jgi:hypothetical protein
VSDQSEPRRFAIVDAELFDASGRGAPQFDLWLVPDEEVAEFRWQRQYPGAALMLVAENHPQASAAWEAGGIHEDEFPFWLVAARQWTESLYRESARRWALAVSGERSIALRFMRSSPLDMSQEAWVTKAAEPFPDDRRLI